MNIVMIGPTGAGKGTQADALSSRHRWQHVATGDLFRQNVQTGTPLGLQARHYMEQGELVPDEIVEAMMEEWFRQLAPDSGSLTDGFPRTLSQARFMDELLARFHRNLDAVIYLALPDAKVIERLAGRMICRTCHAPYHQQLKPPRLAGSCDRCGGELYQRPEDSGALVGARLKTFHRTTRPVLEYYARANKLVVISADAAIAEISAKLAGILEGVRAGTLGFARLKDLETLPVGRVSGAVLDVAPRNTLDLVLLGGPGSGKGTQAQLLNRRFRLPVISSGDLFRNNVREATELGLLAKAYMERGELVPDHITEAMVQERLSQPDAADGFILDGFPRTLPQAEALSEMLVRLQRQLTGVLYIQVSDATILLRLTGRLICRICQAPYHRTFNPPQIPGRCDRCGGPLYQRSDDNPTTVRARLTTFHAQTEPLIQYYRQLGLLEEIDGEGEVGRISERTVAAVQHRAHNLPLTFAGDRQS